MIVALFAALTSWVVIWSLWTRRHTWRAKWETAATMNAALIFVAGCLIAKPPSLGSLIGQWLYYLTGQWNMQFFFAHVCAIAGACMIVHNAVAQLYGDDEMRHWFRTRIKIPTSLGLLAMLALFIHSRCSDTPHPRDFLEMSVRHMWYLSAYWVLYCALANYILLFHGVRAFLDLRRDKGSRPIADVYLCASFCFGVVAAIRIATAVVWKWADNQVLLQISWGAAGLCIMGFTGGAAVSWIRRVRWFTGSGWGGRTAPKLMGRPPQRQRRAPIGGRTETPPGGASAPQPDAPPDGERRQRHRRRPRPDAPPL